MSARSLAALAIVGLFAFTSFVAATPAHSQSGEVADTHLSEGSEPDCIGTATLTVTFVATPDETISSATIARLIPDHATLPSTPDHVTTPVQQPTHVDIPVDGPTEIPIPVTQPTHIPLPKVIPDSIPDPLPPVGPITPPPVGPVTPPTVGPVTPPPTIDMPVQQPTDIPLPPLVPTSIPVPDVIPDGVDIPKVVPDSVPLPQPLPTTVPIGPVVPPVHKDVASTGGAIVELSGDCGGTTETLAADENYGGGWSFSNQHTGSFGSISGERAYFVLRGGIGTHSLSGTLQSTA